MRTILLTITLLLALGVHAQSPDGPSLWRQVNWETAPAFSEMASDSVKEVRFKSVPFDGKEKEVFAYYSNPAILLGTPTDPGRRYPAVMLVHGGGGKAFKDWVKLWAERGYAALALDLRGNDGQGRPLANGYPEKDGITPVYDVALPIGDQWLFHAVADVLIGHSLLRSFPEVDDSRTALTGISWGGVISCLVAGIDHRYQAIVPLYGCGFLENSGFIGEGIRSLDDVSKSRWLAQYDPRYYLRYARTPMLFINGTNDPAFYLSAYAQTLEQVGNGNQSIKIGLEHSHPHGWNNREIYTFIDHVLTGRNDLPQVQVRRDHGGRFEVAIQPNGRNLSAVLLNYTLDKDAVEENRTWNSQDLPLEASPVFAITPPKGCAAWFVSVVDEEGNVFSSIPKIEP